MASNQVGQIYAQAGANIGGMFEKAATVNKELKQHALAQASLDQYRSQQLDLQREQLQESVRVGKALESFKIKQEESDKAYKEDILGMQKVLHAIKLPAEAAEAKLQTAVTEKLLEFEELGTTTDVGLPAFEKPPAPFKTFLKVLADPLGGHALEGATQSAANAVKVKQYLDQIQPLLKSMETSPVGTSFERSLKAKNLFLNLRILEDQIDNLGLSGKERSNLLIRVQASRLLAGIGIGAGLTPQQ